jgi:hypothetical protein
VLPPREEVTPPDGDLGENSAVFDAHGGEPEGLQLGGRCLQDLVAVFLLTCQTRILPLPASLLATKNA